MHLTILMSKVSMVSPEERALADVAAGSLRVGPITPDFGAGGTLIANLSGDSIANQQQHLFRVTGPEFQGGQLFRLTSIDSSRALHYTLCRMGNRCAGWLTRR